jgi:hypothetical protein
VFAALPAVSATTVGALYGLGVLLSVSQLVGAGVPVSDTLPLIPLQDHLAKGLAAVFTSVVLFAAALAVFSLVLWSYASSRSVERRRGSVAASIEQAVAAATAAVDAPGWSAEQEQWEQLKADVAEAKRAGIPDDDPRVAALASRLEELQVLAEARHEATTRLLAEVDQSLGAANAEKAKLQRTRDRSASVARFVAQWRGLLAGALILSALFLPLDVSPAQILLGVLMFFAPTLLWHYHVALFVSLLVAAFLVPFVIALYANPAPLPAASITTDAGTARGGLITASAERYVVSQRAGSYKAIPASEVKSVTVEERKRKRPRSIFQLLT